MSFKTNHSWRERYELKCLFISTCRPPPDPRSLSGLSALRPYEKNEDHEKIGTDQVCAGSRRWHCVVPGDQVGRSPRSVRRIVLARDLKRLTRFGKSRHTPGYGPGFRSPHPILSRSSCRSADSG